MLSFDSTSLVVTAICVAVFSTPFVYYSYQLKKAKSHQLSIIKEFSDKHFFTPTQSQSWRNLYHIAIDSKNQKLIYMKFSEPQIEKIVDLSEVAKISATEKTRSIDLGNEKRSVLSHLAIQFNFKNSSQEAISMEFYDEELFSSLSGEGVIAEKWVQIIKDQLK